MAFSRVLVVEDDESGQELYRQFFEVLYRDRFRWRLAETGERAVNALDREFFDAVVLDLGLPGMTGLEVLKWRERQPAARVIPVLVVSSEAQVRDRVTALTLGADDYLTKKYDPEELLARLQALIRRQHMALTRQGVLDHGWLKIDPLARQVTTDHGAVRLEPKEFDLLLILARHPGMVRSAELLWELLRDEPNPNYRHVLEGDISSIIRNKLGSRARDCLINHKGLGYSLEVRQPV